MKKIIALSALMAALASASAMAADANITFTGEVKASTCIMNANDATKTLVIPDIGAAAASAQSTWATQTIGTTISFSMCPNSVSSVNVANITTTGSPAFSAATSYPASGTATGVTLGIALGEQTSWVATNGNGIYRPFSVTNGSVAIPIRAGVSRASTTTPVTAGDYSSSFTMTFSWS
ncbi:fimbrial protein [Enterobacter asburiae]|uniref:fimbrial protein n=1 Tax=Enterobacter asburiae TaxID=61645 RepID=UPI002A7EDB0D|nr:hypothetical protein [Enterobacter asburiae]